MSPVRDTSDFKCVCDRFPSFMRQISEQKRSVAGKGSGTRRRQEDSIGSSRVGLKTLRKRKYVQKERAGGTRSVLGRDSLTRMHLEIKMKGSKGRMSATSRGYSGNGEIQA